VRVDVEFLDGTERTVVSEVGSAGAFRWQRDTCMHIDALTLTDLAGNTCRVENPHRLAIPARPLPDLTNRAAGQFRCIAGTLEAVNTHGAFVATSDSATTSGFSRGHFEANRAAHGDIDISVKVRRLSADIEMPVELAFRGGFFGVTLSGSWFLYEHDGHWTGWKQLAESVGSRMLELRVVQRGKRVKAYVNGQLAGDLELEKESTTDRVGVAFKGRPGEPSRVRLHDFFVRGIIPE
jgi:hypothetical protein